MGKIINRLAWLLTGIIGAHVGHFIYQKYYLKDFAGKKFSESMAMIFEQLLPLVRQFVDRTTPLVIAHKQLALTVIALVVLVSLLFVWFKVRARTKPYREYKAKIKEAEKILAAAQTKAAAETQKIEDAKKTMAAEFEKQEIALKEQADSILAEAQTKAAAETQKIEDVKNEIAAEFKLKERAIKKESESIVADERKKTAEEMQKIEDAKKEMAAEFEKKEIALKEKAERILTEAQKKAATETQKIEKLKKEMTADFEKKEEQLKKKASEKMGAYIVKISNLEKEQLRLKEINTKLMQKLKIT